jgi:hypothetical protein
MYLLEKLDVEMQGFASCVTLSPSLTDQRLRTVCGSRMFTKVDKPTLSPVKCQTPTECARYRSFEDTFVIKRKNKRAI